MKRAHLDEHTMLTPSTFQMVYRIDDKLLGLVFRNTGACAHMCTMSSDLQ